MTGSRPSLVSELFDRRMVVKIGVGFVIAAVLVYLLGVAVGLDATVTELRSADPLWLAAGCASTALGLIAWGKAWQVVLGVTGIDVRFRKLVVTYYAATFANYVTPLGQAGGEPFIAYVLSRDTEANYEESLASVVTADLLNLLPFFNFAALGLAYLLLQSRIGDTAQDLAWGLGAMAVGVPAAVVAGWRYRDRVEAAVLRVVAPVGHRTGRITVEGVRRRIDGFYRSVERIAGDRRRLLYALCFSYVGWVFFALPLYFSGLALGLPIALLMVFFVVPASTIAGIVPTPGGLAAVEGALVALLVAVVGLADSNALSVAILYRVASYWFALLAGGLAAMYVVYRA